jgi:hypothetical protein
MVYKCFPVPQKKVKKNLKKVCYLLEIIANQRYIVVIVKAMGLSPPVSAGRFRDNQEDENYE